MQNAEFQCQSDHVRSISGAQFQSDIFDMPLDRPGRYFDFLSSLFCRQSLGYQFQYLLFPRRKCRNPALRINVQHSVILFVIATDATSKTVCNPNIFSLQLLILFRQVPERALLLSCPLLCAKLTIKLTPSARSDRLTYILS